ncbi:diguanylate cyclase domain-containing protein [Actibacterium ureilyticum]|uniref:diguanylate cyclase domain-containing protein n=1 Tax=Actibacterium ureilyticum TaxID=1590614 RepID=UPI000BAADD4E|nr:diguanylate cyclase [Actibacterium ureilyticum]
MTVTFSASSLDQLMPMHLLVGPDFRIRRAGPSIQKICGERDLIGQPFTRVFDLRRPRSVDALFAAEQKDATRLHLALHHEPDTPLKGQVVQLQGGRILINLSFGISVVEAVARFGLTIEDFAVTDLAIEMLYLVEANAAVTAELRQMNQRLQGAKIAAQEQAFTDTLTGLKNRRAMEHVLGRLIGSGREFALMHLDLDYFKRVNDTLGHAAGDHVLQRVAEILVSCSRKTDTIVRFGGDEFVLVFDGLTDTKRLEALARRLIGKLEEPMTFAGRSCRISGSIGITLSRFYETPQIDAMLHDADMALYESKNRGRACVSWAMGQGQETLQRTG